MNKRDLLFFCTECQTKTNSELDELECSIPHSVKHYKRGERIATQGDTIRHLLILSQGKVITEMVSNSGLTLTIEQISAPYPLASAFLFAENNHFPVDVTALEPCEVLYITKENVERQMAQCRGFMRGFMAFNANKMHYLSERLKLFAQKGIKAKLVYYILSKEQKGAFDIGKSVSALADYFGVERPSLSRAISEMVRDGVISYQSGKGTILNFIALEKLLH